MPANWDAQKPVFLTVVSDVVRTVNEKGQVFISGGVGPGLLAHWVLVSICYGLGILVLALGLMTFRSKPFFPYQAMVHKQLGRLWVWIMVITGFQSAFIVEVGTPMFVVALISLMYAAMIIGVQIIRTRGDLRDEWRADEDDIAKDESKKKNRDRILFAMKVGHAVFMSLSYMVLFATGIARYPGMRARYNLEPYQTSLCVLDPKGCLGTQLCYPSWMNALTPEANATVYTLDSPYAQRN